MFRLCLLLLAAVASSAAAQPDALTPATSLPPATALQTDLLEWAPASNPISPPARPHLAVVVQQADGNACSGGSCDTVDCSPDISVDGCGNSSSESSCGAGAVGCVVLTGAVGYGLYRLILRSRRPPRPDTLARGSAHLGVVVEALRRHFDVAVGTEAVAGAQVVVTIREAEAPVGLGGGGAVRRLVVEARDASGRPIQLDDATLPRTRLHLDAGIRLAAQAQELAERLAAR